MPREGTIAAIPEASILKTSTSVSSQSQSQCFIPHAHMQATSSNVKFPLQSHQRYYITQYGDLSFHSLPDQMKDDYTTNSHYLTCTVSF